MAPSSRRPPESTPSPSRVIALRRSTSVRSRPFTSATSRRVVFVPRSTTATRMARASYDGQYAAPMRRLLGAAVRRQKTQPPEDASGLADITVKDLEGEDVRLGSLWEERPAVLAFLR